jgi:hypothetical protein
VRKLIPVVAVWLLVNTNMPRQRILIVGVYDREAMCDAVADKLIDLGKPQGCVDDPNNFFSCTYPVNYRCQEGPNVSQIQRSR